MTREELTPTIVLHRIRRYKSRSATCAKLANALKLSELVVEPVLVSMKQDGTLHCTNGEWHERGAPPRYGIDQPKFLAEKPRKRPVSKQVVESLPLFGEAPK